MADYTGDVNPKYRLIGAPDEEYGVHRATRNVVYGPYDPLDFELAPEINTPQTYGPGAVADSFPNHVLAATSQVQMASASRNTDSRQGVRYGSGTDNKPRT